MISRFFNGLGKTANCYDFQSYDPNDFLLFVVPIFELICSFVLVILSCELPGRISDEFVGIRSEIEQIDWYLLPLKMQHILPTILIYAQEPVYFECFGSIPCNRETFKRVSSNIHTHTHRVVDILTVVLVFGKFKNKSHFFFFR